MADLETEWSLVRRGIEITETAPTLSMLRVLRDNTTAARKLGQAFGFVWPNRPGAMADGPIRVGWTAPGQWIVFASASDLARPVASACARAPCHLTDVSAGRRLWRVQGRHARAVISKGCSLDTHPDVMSVNSCASTLLAHTPVLLISGSSSSSFDIIADVSFAGHVQAWFVEATQEFVDDRSQIRSAYPVA